MKEADAAVSKVQSEIKVQLEETNNKLAIQDTVHSRSIINNFWNNLHILFLFTNAMIRVTNLDHTFSFKVNQDSEHNAKTCLNRNQ